MNATKRKTRDVQNLRRGIGARLSCCRCAILLAGSFHSAAGWGLENFTDFFAEPLNRDVFFRTFRLALMVTAVSAVIGYAAAFAIVNLSPRQRRAA